MHRGELDMKKTLFTLSAVLWMFSGNTDALAHSNSQVIHTTSTGLHLNGFQAGDGNAVTLVTRRYRGGHRHHYRNRHYRSHRFGRHYRSPRYGHRTGFRFNYYRPHYRPYRNYYQKPYRNYNDHYRGNGGYSGHNNHRNHYPRHDRGHHYDHNKKHGRHSLPHNRY